MRRRIRNLVDELYKKVTKWTCENCNTIVLPKFETQNMSSKSQKKINSKTARNMLTWSHYRFKTRLMNKTREYPNCRVTLAKLAVNVNFFTARLMAQRSSNVHNVIKNLIETFMQPGIFY
jgi:IS605 OrfB family transposase